MINLLPDEAKDTILYARRNRRLLHWGIALTFGIAGSAIVVLGGLFYINRSTNDYNVQVQRSQEQLTALKLPEIQKRVEDLSSSLKLVVQVLSREILFSKLLQQVGFLLCYRRMPRRDFVLFLSWLFLKA